jgi:tetratricopeptide (TPR) repeat protein
VELNPQLIEGYVNRGLGLHFLGRHDEAIADFDAALRLRPTEAVALNNRGFVYHALGHYARARADYVEAIRVGPSHPNAYKNLARLLATCPDPAFRDGRQAVEHARRAVALSQGSNPAWLAIVAAAYAEMGDFSEAVAWQTRAVEAARGPDKDAQQHRLELFQNGKPYREPPPT